MLEGEASLHDIFDNYETQVLHYLTGTGAHIVEAGSVWGWLTGVAGLIAV